MTSDIRTTQIVAEILQSIDNPQQRATQIVTEILQSVNNPQLRATQLVLEILIYTPTAPSLARGRLGPRIQSM